MTNRTKTGSDAYLIVLRELVIAQDIAQTIGDVDPAARIIVTATPTEALAALADVDRLAVAFVSALPEQFDDLPLRQAIARRGGRAVLLGHEAETAGPSDKWDVLPQPFSTQTVIAILEKAHD